jgi:hypothetical protein
MDKIFKALGSLFFLVWSLIGLVFLIGAVGMGMFFVNGGASQMMQGVVSSFGGGPAGFIGGMMGGAGGVAGLLGGEAQDCIKKAVGEKRMQEIFSGSQPTEKEITKLVSACGKFLPEGMMK